jgi:hypothetical protein
VSCFCGIYQTGLSGDEESSIGFLSGCVPRREQLTNNKFCSLFPNVKNVRICQKCQDMSKISGFPNVKNVRNCQGPQFRRFWSSAITRKEHHSVVDIGPYAFVRHPIYTGIITALLATAVIQATAPALAGAALITYGLWLKARAEERFLVVELGPDSYGSYCRRVPMLIPFLPHR